MFSETPDGNRDGILRQILKTPVYKDILRDNLNTMNPDTGSRLVKTMADEDPEVILSLLSSVPVSLNALINALNEISALLRKNYSPRMIASFINSLAEDIDTSAVKQCMHSWSSLLSSYKDIDQDARLNISSAGYKLTASLLNACAHRINTLIRKNPEGLSSFISEVFSNIDRKEVRQATHALAEALLDQKWHLASWLWELARKRIKKKFGR